jgi:hypothetical protein
MPGHPHLRPLRRNPRREDDGGAAGRLAFSRRRPRGRLPGPYRMWVHNPALVHAVEALGHEGVTDMIVLMGYYTCVSQTMNFYSVPVSGGGTPRH